jgi:hypothetical protein
MEFASVIPAHAGIQRIGRQFAGLDPRLTRG